MSNRDEEIIEVMARAVKGRMSVAGYDTPRFNNVVDEATRAALDALRESGYVVGMDPGEAEPDNAPSHLVGTEPHYWAMGWDACRNAMIAAHTDTDGKGEG